MAYYEGETLKERIERGPLALDEEVDIATQVGNRHKALLSAVDLVEKLYSRLSLACAA